MSDGFDPDLAEYLVLLLEYFIGIFFSAADPLMNGLLDLPPCQKRENSNPCRLTTVYRKSRLLSNWSESKFRGVPSIRRVQLL